MSEPKAAKGGVLAPADVDLIKKALNYYKHRTDDEKEIIHISNLYHRLGRI